MVLEKLVALGFLRHSGWVPLRVALDSTLPVKARYLHWARSQWAMA